MATEYEMALVLRPDLDEERQTAVLTRYRQVIEKHGGSIEEPNIWGKRRLAYEINDQQEGIYIFLPYQAESTANAELDRLLRIDENVLRHIVVLKPRPNPPKPSPLPEAGGPRPEGMRSGPVPAGERQSPGLPVRRSEVQAPAQAAQPSESEPAEDAAALEVPAATPSPAEEEPAQD